MKVSDEDVFMDEDVVVSFVPVFTPDDSLENYNSDGILNISAGLQHALHHNLSLLVPPGEYALEREVMLKEHQTLIVAGVTLVVYGDYAFRCDSHARIEAPTIIVRSPDNAPVALTWTEHLRQIGAL
jgi:hypothetical protein